MKELQTPNRGLAAPKQRNSDGEKADIKAGRVPEVRQGHPAKLRQKDRDARWTLVFGKARERNDGTRHAGIAIPLFGYKNHISIDRRHGFIRRWDVTDAAAHDGAKLRDGLLDRTNTASTVWADSAYRSQANETFMESHGFKSQVHRRKPRGRPMAPHIRRANAARSSARAAIEPVFAHQKGPMALTIRTIGIARAKAKSGLANLTYNFRRLVLHERRPALA
ncbi:hypothetical protein DLJ53_32685 [Acuticoccus sediminis]|uniref:Transposase IS4-like domain-containing protein n=1 Tax=Acuticoccus sediminis TaxID=2184697 RepID=A0A8B2NFC8_9HYPH|nr:hypothetical protein DLJ53_32685 [Acuticoccus sediminis]